MSLHKGGCSTERNGVAAVIFLFLWVLLILAELGFFFAVHEETSKFILKNSTNNSSNLPRKMRFLATNLATHEHSKSSSSSSWFNASPRKPGMVHNNNNNNKTEGDPADTVYEDEKRIIHTGPNPLHN